MIGIDFDNTIVCYDEIFGRVALERGLVPPHAATSKTTIRDHLRSTGQEDRWTELQGTIYGPRMPDAPPFPGVLEFFHACRAAGVPVAIISHRTRFPYLGEQHDLHAAARDWLARHGFHDPAGIGLPADHVFFEETKEAKLARIADVGCSHFIDDLPELLAHSLFPAHVRRILFDPRGEHAVMPEIDLLSSWHAAPTLFADVGVPVPRKVLAEATGPSAEPLADLLASACLPPALTIERLPGGGNNRVYRIETAAGPALLKEYFRHPADPRDRLAAEYAFTSFAWGHGIRALPQPLACDRAAGLGLYEFVVGRKLGPGDVTRARVDEAAAFFTAVNHHHDDPAAARLPIASEACFSISEHIACVDRRVARLATIAPDSHLHRDAQKIVAERLMPAWNDVRAAAVAGELPLDAPLAADARVISPSDFGFHNSLATVAGLKFVDFEYAGWDDPAKMVCDFFYQPQVPVPQQFLPGFVERIAAALGAADGLADRVRLLMPIYGVKWCCIMLNEFLPMGERRRSFARTFGNQEVRQLDQLHKVEAALARLKT